MSDRLYVGLSPPLYPLERCLCVAVPAASSIRCRMSHLAVPAGVVGGDLSDDVGQGHEGHHAVERRLDQLIQHRLQDHVADRRLGRGALQGRLLAFRAGEGRGGEAKGGAGLLSAGFMWPSH